MSTLKLLAIPVSLLLLAACGDSGGGSTGDTTEAGTGGTGDTGGATEPTTGGIDGDPALYQACLDFFAVSHARPSLECECKVADGEFPTVDACVEATGLKFGDEVTCFCEAVALVPESAEILDKPGQQYIACLEPVACDDVPAQDACQDVRLAATEDCPIGLPNRANDISDVRCNGVPGFTCADGLPIPEDKQCDGQPDCLDLSDEQGCP
jgi:hypothetical protein